MSVPLLSDFDHARRIAQALDGRPGVRRPIDSMTQAWLPCLAFDAAEISRQLSVALEPSHVDARELLLGDGKEGGVAAQALLLAFRIERVIGGMNLFAYRPGEDPDVRGKEDVELDWVLIAAGRGLKVGPLRLLQSDRARVDLVARAIHGVHWSLTKSSSDIRCVWSDAEYAHIIRDCGAIAGELLRIAWMIASAYDPLRMSVFVEKTAAANPRQTRIDFLHPLRVLAVSRLGELPA